jgi:hypothetical protein
MQVQLLTLLSYFLDAEAIDSINAVGMRLISLIRIQPVTIGCRKDQTHTEFMVERRSEGSPRRLDSGKARI